MVSGFYLGSMGHKNDCDTVKIDDDYNSKKFQNRQNNYKNNNPDKFFDMKSDSQTSIKNFVKKKIRYKIVKPKNIFPDNKEVSKGKKQSGFFFEKFEDNDEKPAEPEENSVKQLFAVTPGFANLNAANRENSYNNGTKSRISDNSHLDDGD